MAGQLCGGSAGETLVARRDRLRERLELGWEKIDRVEASGGDADALTAFWVALLREYERLCDRIAAEADGLPDRTAGASSGATME